MASRWLTVWPGVDRVRWRSGVYVVIANDASPNCKPQIIYVGSSKNVAKRLGQHGIRPKGLGIQTPWGHYADVVVKIREMATGWRLFEEQLIIRLRPPGNVIAVGWRGTVPRRVKTLSEEGIS